MASTAAGPQVAEFVRALALGWKNLAAYPPGHPALVNSIDHIQRRLAELRGPAGEVVFGIASDGLIYGDEKFDMASAQKFAQALYTRGVAVLRFDASTEVSDIDAFLRLLGVGLHGEQRKPIWEALTAAGVMNINLQPVDYSDVQVTDNLSVEQAEKKPDTLWDEILKALLAGRHVSPDARQALWSKVSSLDELSALILRYVNGIADEPDIEFDPKATFGIKFTAHVPQPSESPEAVSKRLAQSVGAFVSGSAGLKKQLAAQQVVQLLRSLPEPVRGAILRAVVRALATDESAGALLKEFTDDVAQDEVLEALRYLSSFSKLSGHAVMLLQSLSIVHKPKALETAPSPTMVADLVHLFGEEDIDRFNPPDHRALLDDVSMQVPDVPPHLESSIERLGDRVETVADESLSRQVVGIMLNLLSQFGGSRPPDALLGRVEETFRAQLAAEQFAYALETIERLQEIALTTESDEVRNAVHESLNRLASADTIEDLIETLLEAPPSKAADIQRLTEAMGAAATRSLLMALAEESNRSRRRKLFDFVASLGTVIVPEVVGFLDDSRWYVVRNAIVLLRAVNDRTALQEIRRCARHGDLRVRMEAIKTLIALEPSVPQSLLDNAINDPDPKLAEAAIALIGSYGIKEAVGPLVKVLDGFDVFASRRTLRIRVIKALGELAVPSALPSLQRFFTDPFLPWPTRAERRAAYESLSSYPPEARAYYVEKGLKSRDPEVRQICSKLAAR